jgi:hypothetical protein
MTLLLAITYVLSMEMGHASQYKTSTFQNLFNEIKNSSNEWVLTPAITL